MLLINGVWPSWRPLAPLLMVIGLAMGLILGLIWSWWPLWALLGFWLGVLLIAVRGRPLDVVVAATMHIAYGVGLLTGFFRSPSKVRAQVVSRSGP
jgi:hypothetical protein